MVKAIQFHRVTPKVQFCGTWNYPGQFDEFIDFIRRRYEIILPGSGEAGLVITFDDGDRSVYRYAFPILKKYGVKAVVFLIADYIGKENRWDITTVGRSAHLTWDEIKEMKEWGIEFGSHTLSHRNLTMLTRAEIVYELSESRRIIEEKIGPIRCISYPFNRVNGEVVGYAKQAGYKYGFGGGGQNDLLLKKEAVYITDNVISLNTKIRERPQVFYRYDRLKQRIINYFTIATMLTRR